MRWYWGLAALAVGTGAGAALGALAAPPCNDQNLLCGPRLGAGLGAGTGLLVVGLAGLGAALSPDYRAAGLVAAGATAAVVAAGAIRAAGQPTS